MRLLSRDEFRETFAAPMQRRSPDAEPPIDFWTYFNAIPSEAFSGRRCEGNVTYVYRDAASRFEHILVDTDDRNVFMAIVVDLHARSVFGHHLLDLNVEYGLIGKPS
jgi:hypothetical protein